jgi:hypothetical protein
MTVVNLRGANGSGKSTIVKKFLATGFKELHGMIGPRRPEAYEVRLAKLREPLFVLGPYETSTGGVDALGAPLIDFLYMLEKYAKRGHVLFESVIISTTFGAVGAWMVDHKDDVIVAYLDTPLDECLKAITARGALVGTTNVAEKVKSVSRTKTLMEEAGIRTELLTRDTAFDSIGGWFKHA